jgi:hypothetical protein
MTDTCCTTCAAAATSSYAALATLESAVHCIALLLSSVLLHISGCSQPVRRIPTKLLLPALHEA